MKCTLLDSPVIFYMTIFFYKPSIGSRIVREGGGGARNMKYKAPQVAGIFFMTNFNETPPSWIYYFSVLARQTSIGSTFVFNPSTNASCTPTCVCVEIHVCVCVHPLGAAPNFHACVEKKDKSAHAHVGVHEALN